MPFIRSKRLSGTSLIEPRLIAEALLTHMSMPPNCSTVCATAAATDPSSRMSPTIGSACPPASSSSFAAVYTVPGSFGCGSAVLAISAMLAPSAAARLAISNPMPRLAPEMNMVFPESDMAVTLGRADIGGDRVRQPDQILRVQRDVPAALTRTAEHPVPVQRRGIDHGRQRLALADRRYSPDHVPR